jgi:hypothetical protein
MAYIEWAAVDSAHGSKCRRLSDPVAINKTLATYCVYKMSSFLRPDTTFFFRIAFITQNRSRTAFFLPGYPPPTYGDWTRRSVFSQPAPLIFNHLSSRFYRLPGNVADAVLADWRL